MPGKLSITFPHLSLAILPLFILVFGEFLIELTGNHFLFLEKAKLQKAALTVATGRTEAQKHAPASNDPGQDVIGSGNPDAKASKKVIEVSNNAIQRFFNIPPAEIKSKTWLTTTEQHLVRQIESAKSQPADIGDAGFKVKKSDNVALLQTLENVLDELDDLDLRRDTTDEASQLQSDIGSSRPLVTIREQKIAWIVYTLKVLDDADIKEAMARATYLATTAKQPDRDRLITYALSVQHNLGLLKTAELSDAGRIKESRYRINFLISYLIFLLVCIGITLHFVIDITLNFTRASQIRIVIFAAIISVISYGIFMFTLGDRPNLYQYVGFDLFDDMFRYAFVPSCIDGSLIDLWSIGFFDCSPNSMKEIFIAMIWLIGLISSLAIASAIIGVLTAMAIPVNYEHIDDRFDDYIVDVRRDRAFRYLYFSSAILVFGILLLAAWKAWPLSLFPELLSSTNFTEIKILQDEYQFLTAQILTYKGINYTLAIASFFVPVRIVLDHMERKVAMACAIHSGHGPIPSPDNIKRHLKGMTTTLQQLMTYLSTLLPILAPTIASIIAPLITLSNQFTP